MAAQIHQFNAIAFEENFNLRRLAPHFPGARATLRELRHTIAPGAVYVFPFGAIVTHDLPADQRDAELQRLHTAMPKLTAKVVREDYTVAEDAAFRIGIVDGVLRLDRFTPARAGIVALTVAQSAAMEYYENLVEDLFERTGSLIEFLERRGTVRFRIRPLHRFIGEAIGTRTEVLSILHLLDKPDEAWDDPAMDRIYDDLRGEFDLRDRYAALELKLRSIQESLELLVDVARDRRLLVLEITVVFLILLELVFTILPALRSPGR
jgi:required for meiotic nuclear division protein 1